MHRCSIGAAVCTLQHYAPYSILLSDTAGASFRERPGAAVGGSNGDHGLNGPTIGAGRGGVGPTRDGMESHCSEKHCAMHMDRYCMEKQPWTDSARRNTAWKDVIAWRETPYGKTLHGNTTRTHYTEKHYTAEQHHCRRRLAAVRPADFQSRTVRQTGDSARHDFQTTRR